MVCFFLFMSRKRVSLLPPSSMIYRLIPMEMATFCGQMDLNGKFQPSWEQVGLFPRVARNLLNPLVEVVILDTLLTKNTPSKPYFAWRLLTRARKITPMRLDCTSNMWLFIQKIKWLQRFTLDLAILPQVMLILIASQLSNKFRKLKIITRWCVRRVVQLA